MRQVNAHGEVRIVIPEGYSKNGQVHLRGAAISDESHNYLGWWPVAQMNRLTREELQKELEDKWFPKNYDPEAL